MPGFNIGGANTLKPNAVTEIRRKHRWSFLLGVEDIGGVNTAILFLQKAARPNCKFEEATLFHDQEKAYYAGQTTWEPIELIWYDAEQNPNCSNIIYQWVNKVSKIPDATVGQPNTYKKISNVQQHDGMGTVTEKWTLYNSWPQQTNWNDLDYTNNDLQTINITLRFDRATVEYPRG